MKIRRFACAAVFLLLAVSFLLMTSCVESGADGGEDSAVSDGGQEAGSPGIKELRGIYIATVYNIDFPSRQGLGKDELAAELDSIVENTLSLGCGDIYFQVRGASDAMYDSKLFPISEYLTGKKDGELPEGFDPLAYLVEHAHSRGVRVHAWVNPLRVTRGGSAAKPKTDVELLPEGSPARKTPELTLAYEGELYYDPGVPETRRLVADGVRELVENYEIDGVLFDDYFYPYPKTGVSIPDEKTYEKYGAGEDIGDFRRDNINKMVKGCYDAIKAADPECLFGIAPFGIWQNDDGVNGGSATRGLESYESLYCDTLAWVEGGYVDYIAPQIYWSFSQKSAPYAVLADWWNAALDGTGVDLCISHAAYKYGTDEWSFAGTVGELGEQLSYARELITYRGSILYGYSSLVSNTDGVASEAKKSFENEIYYRDESGDGGKLKITEPKNRSKTDLSTVTLCGESAPGEPVLLNGRKISRRHGGKFYVTAELVPGKNEFLFVSGERSYKYTLTYTAKNG